MGKSNSKDENVHQAGDTNVNIIQHLEQNQNRHDEHEIKLWIILAIVIIQLILVLRKTLKKKWRRQGFEKGKAISTANIADV